MKLNSLKLLLLGVFIVIFCLPKKAFSQAVVITGLTGNAPTYLTQGATSQVVFGFSIQVPANKTFNPGVLHIATSNGLNGFVSGNLIRTTAATPSLAISSPQGSYGLAINTTLDVNSFPSLTAGASATTFYFYVVLSITTTANTPPASVYFSLPLAALISQNGYSGGITVNNLATPTTYYFGVNPPTVSSVSNCGAATLTMTASDASPSGGTYKWYSAATGGTTLQNSTSTTYSPYINSTTTYYVSYTSGTIESARTAVTATIYPTVSSPFTSVSFAYPFNAGSTADITGNGNTATATYQTAAQNEGTSTGPPTTSADRYGAANSSYTFDGKGQYMSTTTKYTDPTLYTLSLWFNTTTIYGGKLIGFDSSLPPGSGQFDRHIYMTNAGTLIYGVYSSATLTIVSAKAYNDGNWHHVVVTQSPTAGAVMYVDGVSVASSTTMTAPETDNGYWRIGGDNLSGWPSSPSSNYFAGQIDDIGVYSTAQTAAQVASSDNLNLIGFPPTASCSGNPITFSAQTITGATYTWTDPSGSTMTGQNPTFASSVAGNYTLMVTGGPGGCSSTATAPSNVNTAPSATFTSSSSVPVTINPTITYTGTDPTTSTYAWTFTGATPATGSGQTPPSITYAATGTYTISLSVTNASGCVTTSSHTISVVALPAPTLSYTPSTDNYYYGTTISTLTPTSTYVGALGSYGASSSFGSGYSGPEDVAVDASGNIYVTNVTSNTVRKFNSSGTFVSTFGTGLSQPYNISFDASGNAYITNYGANTITKITSAGVQSTFISSGLTNPFGTTEDANGNVYVANFNGGSGSAAILEYNSSGTLVQTITTPGPTDVAVDASGNIYALNFGTGTVSKYNSAGVFQSTIVTGLSNPFGLTIDASGNIYIADSGNIRVLEYTSSGTLFNTISTTGTPRGVAVDPSGDIYVTLNGTNAVAKYIPTGGYYINKSLPAGLMFNSSTGAITGTPAAVSPLTAYTVTAFNATGSVSTMVNISVGVAAPTASPVTQCGAGATLTAAGGNPAGGTYNWYTTATGGTAIQSSTSATLANIQSTATYYVSYTSSGTESARTPVTATINPIVSAPYSGAYLSYSFNGNTNDVSGTSNNGTNNGATLTTDRYGASNAAYSFNGTSNYMDNSVLDNNPLNYTVSIWFQTTATIGGSLIGLESGNYDDRVLYMSNSGQIYWGLYPGTVQSINTTTSYNDGNWHHVIVTVSSVAGSTLYVDGIAQATNAAMTTANGVNGFWQIGYSYVTGWTNGPSDNYFTGSLDDIAVYHRVLSSTEIASSNNLNQIFVGTASACGALSFTAPTIIGATYTWTDPNSNTLTGQTVSFPGAVAGNYTLTVTGGPGGCSSSATLTPVISAAVASAFFVPASIAVSTNTTVTLYSSVTGSTYSWNFGGGTSSSGTTGTGPFTVQWSTIGVKTITLTVTTAGGCVTTTTNIITVTTNGYGNYTYSRNLTLNNAAVGMSGNLSSFPVLLSIQNNDLIVTGTCADKIQNPTGPNYDFAFFDPSAQSELYYQVESYNSTTGTLLVWVRVPTMYAATNNTIYFYYGAKVPLVTHNAAFSALTWNTDYQSVYHFNESAYSPTTADGTSNGRNATLVGFSSANYVAAGKIGSCYSFGNVADMESAAEPASTVFTLSAWVNTTSTGLDEKVLCNQNSSGTASGGYKLGVYYGSAETEAVYNSDRSSTTPTEPALTTNTWYYIQGVYDGSTISTYVNGVQYKKYSVSGTSSFSNILYIGIGEGKSYPFSGMIDEPRVSNVAKSSDWIKMEYSNQNNPTAFIISSSAPTCNYATGGSIPGEISYTWTGTTSTDPTVATNWTNSVTAANALPPFDGTESLTIPAGLSKYPVLTASESVYGLTIANGASLSLNGFTLSVACHIYNGSGGSILYGSTSTAGGITFNGSLATQYYYGTTTGIANIANLTVNNSAAGTVDITGGAFGVSNILTLTSGNLFIDNTNSGSLTLLSTATNSGSVAAIPSAYNITGNVNVQRYITSGAGTRGYRLLTSPVNVNSSIAGTGSLGLTYLNTNTTFNSTTYNGAYTQGPGTGFTYNGSAHPIIYLYDQSQATYNGSFTGGKNIGIYSITGSTGSPAYGVITQGTSIASTAVNIPIANSYLLYFVGSDISSVVSNTRVPDATTLTATGYLNQGTIPFVFWKSASASLPYNVTTGTSNYGLYQVGNPYPSTISLATLYTDNYNAGTNPISPFFYELIPAGNYVSYNASNGYVSDTRASKYVVSGQGFLAQITASGQTFTFKEDQKIAYSSSSPFLESISGPALADAHITNTIPSTTHKSHADALTLMAPVNTNSGPGAGLHMQLSLDSTVYAQTGIYYSSTGLDKYLSSEDAVEVDGGTPLVYLSSYSSDSVKLSINTMADYGQGKRVRLYVNAVNSGVYSMSLADITNIDTSDYSVFLIDNKMQDSLDVVRYKSYSFNLNLSDTTTFGSNRFVLAIDHKSVKQYLLSTFSGQKVTTGVQLKWTAVNAGNYTGYTLQKLNANGSYDSLYSVQSDTSIINYGFIDTHPVMGNNTYRLAQNGINGAITYSATVTVGYNSATPNGALTLYPNPAQSILNVSLTTSTINTPTYEADIYNSLGVRMSHQTVSSATWTNDVSSYKLGVYVMQIKDTNGNIIGQAKFVKVN